jgi:hypothetical protein
VTLPRKSHCRLLLVFYHMYYYCLVFSTNHRLAAIVCTQHMHKNNIRTGPTNTVDVCRICSSMLTNRSRARSTPTAFSTSAMPRSSPRAPPSTLAWSSTPTTSIHERSESPSSALNQLDAQCYPTLRMVSRLVACTDSSQQFNSFMMLSDLDVPEQVWSLAGYRKCCHIIFHQIVTL